MNHSINISRRDKRNLKGSLLWDDILKIFVYLQHTGTCCNKLDSEVKERTIYSMGTEYQQYF